VVRFTTWARNRRKPMTRALHTAAAALAIVSGLAGAVPAMAQPIEITVPGGTVQPAPLAPSNRTVRPSRLFDYHLDFDNRFDPGEAALDSQFYTRRRPSMNLVRAAVLDRHGISLAEHQLRCQSLHATYEPVSNTYLGPDGLPRHCVY
jgi:hypothetical protein